MFLSSSSKHLVLFLQGYFLLSLITVFIAVRRGLKRPEKRNTSSCFKLKQPLQLTQNDTQALRALEGRAACRDADLTLPPEL